MLLNKFVTLALSTCAIAASSSWNDWKSREFQKFQQLKKSLLNSNYDVEEVFCKDGKFTFEYSGPHHLYDYHLSLYTMHLLYVKEKIEKAGWDSSEFFCRKTEKVQHKRGIEQDRQYQGDKVIDTDIVKRYRAHGRIFWPVKTIHDLIEQAFKDEKEGKKQG